MPTTSDCPSCGTPRQDRFCAHCGERFLEADDLNFRHFLHTHVLQEMADLDRALPRTLRVLFTRPGQLALDYVSGRRRPFVSPLRLYLVTFVLFAFVATLFSGPHHSLIEQVQTIDVTGVLSRLMAARPNVNWADPALRMRLEEHTHWIGEAGTLLVFFGVAALQTLIFFRRRRPYLEHLALALTVSAFFAIALTAVVLALAIFPRHSSVAVPLSQELLALTALPLYWFLAIRRFYTVNRVNAALAAIGLTVGNWMLALVLNNLLFAVMIMRA